jgi:hypothetical protein
LMERDFRDMLGALSDEKVEYLVVVAHAMAVHGCPRATHDIDFWVRPCTCVFQGTAHVSTLPSQRMK